MKILKDILSRVNKKEKEVVIGKPILFIRNDESKFKLNPYLTQKGTQVTEKFYIKDEIKEIPKFRYFDENGADDLLGTDIYLDINPNILKQEYYRNCVANLLLSNDRIQEIKEEDNQYAGGFKYNKEGKVIGIDSNQKQIDSLNRLLSIEEKEQFMTTGINKLERITQLNKRKDENKEQE